MRHRADRIISYADWQTKPFYEFVAEVVGTKLPATTRAQGVVQASVNHGRWIAECPTGDGGAMMVALDDLYFLCPVCRNELNGGLWYDVRVPAPSVRRALEEALLRRPAQDGFNAPTRNWVPGETVADLVAENTRMGLD